LQEQTIIKAESPLVMHCLPNIEGRHEMQKEKRRFEAIPN
jgi:hypothetical protein